LQLPVGFVMLAIENQLLLQNTCKTPAKHLQNHRIVLLKAGNSSKLDA